MTKNKNRIIDNRKQIRTMIYVIIMLITGVSILLILPILIDYYNENNYIEIETNCNNIHDYSLIWIGDAEFAQNTSKFDTIRFELTDLETLTYPDRYGDNQFILLYKNKVIENRFGYFKRNGWRKDKLYLNLYCSNENELQMHWYVNSSGAKFDYENKIILSDNIED